MAVDAVDRVFPTEERDQVMALVVNRLKLRAVPVVAPLMGVGVFPLTVSKPLEGVTPLLVLAPKPIPLTE